MTLKGKVKWNFEREAAEDAVCKLPGVKGVFNEIIIEQRPQPKDVSTLISDALARNAQIDARSIKVTAKGSTVVLDGSVRSLAERDEAEGAAWTAPGVSVVENNLAVTLTSRKRKRPMRPPRLRRSPPRGWERRLVQGGSWRWPKKAGGKTA